MRITMIIVAVMLTLAVWGSAAGKLRHVTSVVQSMAHVGVRANRIPQLAVLEIAGGIGLVVGLSLPLIGRLAAAGLVLYFLGAVVAHLRVKDEVKAVAPAVILFILSVVTLALEIKL